MSTSEVFFQYFRVLNVQKPAVVEALIQLKVMRGCDEGPESPFHAGLPNVIFYVPPQNLPEYIGLNNVY